MLIKAISHIAGPGLVATSGQVVDVDPDMAKQLIAGGYAVPDRSVRIETTMVEPPEKAGQPKATKRGKAK